MEHVELVCNGKVLPFLRPRTSPVDHGDFSGSIALKESGWCVALRSSDQGKYPVLDTYVYATTSPIYVSVAGRQASFARRRALFRRRGSTASPNPTAAYPDWNNDAEKRGVMQRLADAKAVFVALE